MAPSGFSACHSCRASGVAGRIFCKLVGGHVGRRTYNWHPLPVKTRSTSKMPSKSTKQSIPLTQRKLFDSLFKSEKEVKKVNITMRRVLQQQHKIIGRIFDAIEKNPSIYNHISRARNGEPERSQPMTLDLAKEARSRYEGAFAKALQFAILGCNNCPKKQFCICVCDCPIVGCCYLCLSPDIIQC